MGRARPARPRERRRGGRPLGALRRPLAADGDPLRRRRGRRRRSTAHSRARRSSASSARTCDDDRRELGGHPRGRGDRVLGCRALARAEARAAAGRPRPTRRIRARRERRHRALPPPGRDLGGGAARRERRRHDRHGVGQVARVQPARPRRDRARAEDTRALPLPDEGALAGSGALARRAPAEGAPSRDLRRRHAERAALADPQVVEPRPDEPGHAAHRRPPAPRPLGRRAREPALRRHRRGTRLSRGLRLSRRERAPAAAPARADLRRRAAVPAGVRDDRERRRARARADRAGRDRRRSGHVCASRARGRHLEPSAPRRRARPAGEPARRRGASSLPAHVTRPADDLLREEPQGGGADPPLRGRARGHRNEESARAVPRRLHGRAAS